ncbi:MAG TPA: hypothetical protein VMV23_01855 [Candidatus Nanopelagicaceae bacterium]|nr:hypothetical protein [Candidatus Nanopelagicaceae bacterium]
MDRRAGVDALPDSELIRLSPAAAAMVAGKDRAASEDSWGRLEQQKFEAGGHLAPQKRAGLEKSGAGGPRHPWHP